MEQTFASRVLADRPPESVLNRPGAAEGFSKSAASWPAIFAGAFVAVSASLVLVALGGGLGFAEISPWPGRGASATTFTVTTAIWLIVTQWLSAALGGYIAGRLRTKWVGTHTHEVFFRDTAHGLVTWAVATVTVAAVLAGSISALVGGGLRAAGNAASGGAPAALTGASAPGLSSGPMPQAPGMLPGVPSAPSAALTYEIDKLFRPPGPGAAEGAGAAARAMDGTAVGSANPVRNPEDASDPRVEAVYIAFNAMTTGGVPDADRVYLADLVADQTGIAGAAAQRRVDDFIAALKEAQTKARAAADAARKAAAEASIYTALAMLVGAFIACVSAALGGRLRDEHP